LNFALQCLNPYAVRGPLETYQVRQHHTAAQHLPGIIQLSGGKLRIIASLRCTVCDDASSDLCTKKLQYVQTTSACLANHMY